MNRFICYHFVFRTYKGKPILIDPVVVEFLHKTFREISIAKEFRIIKSKILADHVHCLMEFDVNHRVDYVVRMIKGISSRRFFEEFNTNRYVSRKLWRRSYFAEIVKPQHLDIVSRYIEQQMRMGIDKRDI